MTTNLTALESERFSIAYLHHDPKWLVKQTQDHDRREALKAIIANNSEQAKRERDREARIRKVYFDAGRYYAGDRDAQATQAYNLLIQKKGNQND